MDGDMKTLSVRFRLVAAAVIAFVALCFSALPATAFADEATLTMNRFYNPYTGEHFYTSNQKECDSLLVAGWKSEGIGWVAPKTSKTPVYRLYNPYVQGGDHHYTMDVNEYNKLGELGWEKEGIGWYSDDAERVPLYRQYNRYAVTGTHNYTTSKAENDFLVGKGWKAEGFAWYAVATGKPAESGNSNGTGNNAGGNTGTQTGANAQLSTVYVTKSGEKFHRQTCPSIANRDVRAIARTEAIESGKTPCKVCEP